MKLKAGGADDDDPDDSQDAFMQSALPSYSSTYLAVCVLFLQLRYSFLLVLT